MLTHFAIRPQVKFMHRTYRMGVWQTWRDDPGKSPVLTFLFQVHFWVGALIGAYVFVMSVSGAMIVYRGSLFEMGLSVERIVDAGSIGTCTARQAFGVFPWF